MHDYFQGIRLDELAIDSVEWLPEAVAHMRARRAEQGAYCPEPEEATEAALEPGRIVRVARPDASIKVIGRADSTNKLLKVWLQPIDVIEGDWYGQSACEANSSDFNRYKEANQ